MINDQQQNNNKLDHTDVISVNLQNQTKSEALYSDKYKFSLKNNSDARIPKKFDGPLILGEAIS